MLLSRTALLTSLPIKDRCYAKPIACWPQRDALLSLISLCRASCLLPCRLTSNLGRAVSREHCKKIFITACLPKRASSISALRSHASTRLRILPIVALKVLWPLFRWRKEQILRANLSAPSFGLAKYKRAYQSCRQRALAFG